MKAMFRLNDVLYQVAAILPAPGTARARGSVGLEAHVYRLALDCVNVA